MTLLFVNILLMVVGPFLFIGLLAIPVLVQWPVPASQVSRRPVRRPAARPVFRPAMAGGWG